MSRHKILTISSFPSNGNAGLKMAISILGTHAIPVPTLLLSGTGNMEGHRRFDVPLAAMLESTLQLAEKEEDKLAVYAGYLSDAGQAGIISELLSRFSHIIDFILVDPVCGDNGKAYIAPEIIDSMHTLIPLADLITPNVTELGLLTGHSYASLMEDPTPAIDQLDKAYPHTEIILTGFIKGTQVFNTYYMHDGMSVSIHPLLPGYFTGTGDAFATLYLFYQFISDKNRHESFTAAGKTMDNWLSQSEDTFQVSLLEYSPLLTTS